jgi:hypothetical protein
MIPHSPVLFLTAVRATARWGSLPVCMPSAATIQPSFRFVHEAGMEAHRALWDGYSSWPLQEATSVSDLVRLARHHQMLRHTPRAADLVVWTVNGEALVGVIDEVMHHGGRAPGRLARCVVFVANRGRRSTELEVRRSRRLCSVLQGDHFIRWYDGDLSHRRAA